MFNGSPFCKKYFPSKLGSWYVKREEPESYAAMKSDLSDLDDSARILYSMSTRPDDGCMHITGYLIVQRNPRSKGGNPIKRILRNTDPDRRA